MIIKFDAVSYAPDLTVEPQTFGTVASKEELKESLIDIILERISHDITLNEDDVDVFFELLKANGSVEEDS